MTEQDLVEAILNDALLSAAYKLGRTHGYQRALEDWYRDQHDELPN